MSTDMDSLGAMLGLGDVLQEKWWHSLAACRFSDPDSFFPASSQQPNAALALCVNCPVKSECLEAGMLERYGVWGGTTENERKKMRRQLNISIDGRTSEGRLISA